MYARDPPHLTWIDILDDPTPDEAADGTLDINTLIALELLDPETAANDKRAILHGLGIVCADDEDPLAAWLRAMHADNPGWRLTLDDILDDPNAPRTLRLFLYFLIDPAPANQGDTYA